MGGRTGNVGSLGSGKRSSARNHWRGRRLQSRKSGGRSDRQVAKVEGVRGLSRKLERLVLGGYSAQIGMGRRAQEVTTHKTGGADAYERRASGFGR